MPAQRLALWDVAKALGNFLEQAGEVERRHRISKTRQVLDVARLKRRIPRFSLQDFLRLPPVRGFARARSGRRIGSKHAAAGYLFQDLVKQHPELVSAVGRTVSTARIAALVGDDSTHILAAVWRIARVGNMTDNFDKGRAGNLLGAIDCSNGVVDRVISGYGLSEVVVRTHPDTAAVLEGLRLPDWDRAIDMVRRGAAAYPNLRFQHWDVAFSETGPVALEVNAMGSTGMLQYASRKGLLTPMLRAFLTQYGQTSSRLRA